MKINLFKSTNKVKDPVCLMKVTKDKTTINFQYGGKFYYFCSASCFEEFKENPAKYAD